MNPIKIKIVLACKNPHYRKLIQVGLESYNIQVMGHAESEEELLNLLEIEIPSVVVYDIYLTPYRFEETYKAIFKISSDTKLFVFGDDYSELIERCLELGAYGFYDESLTRIDLIAEALKKIHNGEKVGLIAEKISF